MQRDLALVKPTRKYASQVMHYKQEMLANNDSLDVPSEVFLAIRKADDKLVGIIDFRRPLSPFLLQYGGNIGYSILPSERQKGYAKAMLALLLPICKEQGEQRVLLTCHKSNEASRRTIISNGGKMENEIVNGTGRNEDSIIQRFWIDL